MIYFTTDLQNSELLFYNSLIRGSIFLAYQTCNTSMSKYDRLIGHLLQTVTSNERVSRQTTTVYVSHLHCPLIRSPNVCSASKGCLLVKMCSQFATMFVHIHDHRVRNSPPIVSSCRDCPRSLATFQDYSPRKIASSRQKQKSET